MWSNCSIHSSSTLLGQQVLLCETDRSLDERLFLWCAETIRLNTWIHPEFCSRSIVAATSCSSISSVMPLDALFWISLEHSHHTKMMWSTTTSDVIRRRLPMWNSLIVGVLPSMNNQPKRRMRFACFYKDLAIVSTRLHHQCHLERIYFHLQCHI